MGAAAVAVVGEQADIHVSPQEVVEVVAEADAAGNRRFLFAVGEDVERSDPAQPDQVVVEQGVVEREGAVLVAALEGVGHVAAQIPARADLDRHVFGRLVDIDRRLIVSGKRGRQRRQRRRRKGQAHELRELHLRKLPSFSRSRRKSTAAHRGALLTIVVKWRLRITTG